MDSQRLSSVYLVGLSLIFLALAAFFQGCAAPPKKSTPNLELPPKFDLKDYKFMKSQGQQGMLAKRPKDRGMMGGRINIGISHKVYNYYKGQVDYHIPGYDDIFNTKSVDFFDLAKTKEISIQNMVPKNKRFVLLLSNGNLSPGTIIEINGRYTLANEYQNYMNRFFAGKHRALPTFTLSPPAHPGDTQLTSLKLIFMEDELKQNRIIGTRPDCVLQNYPGRKGEYRNGALTLQAVDRENLSLNRLTGTAGAHAKLLWESLLFWDQANKTCY